VVGGFDAWLAHQLPYIEPQQPVKAGAA
jgi:hypothetical protein